MLYLNARNNGKMRDYYRICENPLGTGAFGEVRKCVYRESTQSKSYFKQYRAVKIIGKNHMEQSDLKMFHNEVEIMLYLEGKDKDREE